MKEFLCPSCNKVMGFSDFGSIMIGYYTCLNDNCPAVKMGHYTNITLSSNHHTLDEYYIYFVEDLNVTDGLELYGNLRANKTYLRKISRINGNGGTVTIKGGHSTGGTGGNLIITGGSGGHITFNNSFLVISGGSSNQNNGGTTTFNTNNSGIGFSGATDMIISVPFIAISTENNKFHVEAKLLLQRLKKLIIFS